MLDVDLIGLWSAYTINWGVLCVDLIGPYTYTIKGKDISQCNRL